MKRPLLALCLCLIVVSTLVSCGATEKGTQTEETATKAKAEAKYAELLKRQNEFIQQQGEGE